MISVQFALELMDGTVFGAEPEYGTSFAKKSPSFSQQPLKVSDLAGLAVLAGKGSNNF